jgi:hypothetical protein
VLPGIHRYILKKFEETLLLASLPGNAQLRKTLQFQPDQDEFLLMPLHKFQDSLRNLNDLLATTDINFSMMEVAKDLQHLRDHQRLIRQSKLRIKINLNIVL